MAEGFKPKMSLIRNIILLKPIVRSCSSSTNSRLDCLWGWRWYNRIDRPENLIIVDGTHTDIAVAHAFAMIADVDACEHARLS